MSCIHALSLPFLHRLLQRYQNVKNEMEAQQNLERLRTEKQNQISLAASKSKRKTAKR